MKYEPIITKNSIIFELYKPIFGSRFGIWDKHLKHTGGKRIVVITPMGKATFSSAAEYKRKATINKRYYKNPDEPMKFYVLDFKPEIDAREKRKKQEAKFETDDTQKVISQWGRLALMWKRKQI